MDLDCDQCVCGWCLFLLCVGGMSVFHMVAFYIFWIFKRCNCPWGRASDWCELLSWAISSKFPRSFPFSSQDERQQLKKRQPFGCWAFKNERKELNWLSGGVSSTVERKRTFPRFVPLNSSSSVFLPPPRRFCLWTTLKGYWWIWLKVWGDPHRHPDPGICGRGFLIVVCLTADWVRINTKGWT